MKQKLRSCRGETLVEVLASVLIAALSVALLFGSVMASARLDDTARRQDSAYYQALSAAETQSSAAGGGSVVLKNPTNGTAKSLSIRLYGGAGMFSYTPGSTP